MIRRAVAAAALAAAATITAPAAHALPPNCVQQPWLYGGLIGRWTVRTICDGPIRPDGSWDRAREFYADETYVPVRCSWSIYSGSCWGGYWLPVFDLFDRYSVTPDTVLPDEPGHINP